MTLRRLVPLGILVGALSWGAGLVAPSRAEVSVREGVIIVLAIVDDPEPFGAWREEGGTASGRRVLNAEGWANGDGRPSVVVHPATRTPIVAWARNSATGFDVAVAWFEDGAWSTPVVLPEPSGDALDPQLAVDPSTGDVHLFYWLDDGSPRVLHRSAPADLVAWSEPALVSLPGEIAVRPSAVVHGGTLYVAYESHGAGLDATPRQIVVAERDDDDLWQATVVAGSDFAGPNAPRIHGRRDRLWVEWFDGDDVMRWTGRTDGGTWTALGSEPFSGLEDREYHVRGRVRAAVRAQE